MTNFEKLCQDYRMFKRTEEEAKKECERLKEEILAIMCGEEVYTEGFSKASYKCTLQSRFNQKDFERDYPALFDRYKKESPVYRFLVS
nr:MAG TPA: hypothetical protein [Caudoviricetes sp.]